MTGKELLQGLSCIDEKYVDEAQNETIKKSGSGRLRRWVFLAACLCIVLGAAFAYDWMMNGEETEALNDGSAQLDSTDSVEGTPGQGITEEREQEPSAGPDEKAEDTQTAEAPCIVIQVDSKSGDRFTGTVIRTSNTDAFQVGDWVSVVPGNVAKTEAAGEEQDSNKSVSQYIQTQDGSMLEIKALSYDETENCLFAELLTVDD